jgi:hypothetical protein
MYESRRISFFPELLIDIILPCTSRSALVSSLCVISSLSSVLVGWTHKATTATILTYFASPIRFLIIHDWPPEFFGSYQERRLVAK